MVLSESEYKLAVKAGRAGVYVLCGVESYLIRHYRDLVRAPYVSAETSFDHVTVVYESKDDAWAITDAASTPGLPIMSMISMMTASDGAAAELPPHKRLVEVVVESMDSMAQSDIDVLIAALSESAAYDDAIVLLCLMPGTFDCGDPKRPSANYKKLCAADGVKVVYFPATTPAQLRRWIERHFTHEGLTPEHDTADALISFSGTDMTTVSGEIDKLTAYVKSHGRDRVTAADVEEVCCRNERYDAFALSNAILDGRCDAALSALADERRRRTEPVVVSAGIARVIADMMAVKALHDSGASSSQISAKLGMHEYKVKLYMKSAAGRSSDELKRAVIACSDADRKLKSSGGDGYEALERLICTVGGF